MKNGKTAADKAKRTGKYALHFSLFIILFSFVAACELGGPVQIPYFIVYHPNGGSGEMDGSSFIYGTTQNLRANTFTLAGHAFTGWARTPNGAVEFADRASVTNLTAAGSTVTLYAQWALAYEVVFFADGGSPAPPPQMVVIGGTVTEPDTMTKTGYALEGWYTEAAFTNRWNFASDTVTADITLYAKWGYAVNFNANGGEPEPPAQIVVQGGTVTEPPAMTKTGCTFGGWYKEVAFINEWNFNTDTVSGNITIYAQWHEGETVPGATLAAKLAWLQTNAQSNGTYTLEVDTDESIYPYEFSYSGKSNITVILRGIGSNLTVYLSSNGSITVGSGVTLVLDKNITLHGRTANPYSLVWVNSGGSLRMNDGSAVTSNTISSSSTSGGGVYVNGGTFIMSGGTVSGNTASSNGGGVYVSGGTFTMSGGEIRDNTASGPSSSNGGGGVYVGNGTFTMSGGTVSGNSASSNGGGVYVGNGTFTMSGGTVSGNSSSSNGGGVYVGSNGSFTKTGDTVTGYSSDTATGNVVKSSSGTVQNSRGHAVYATAFSVTKRKETTAGPEVNLSWSGNNNSPVFSGGWDY